MPVLVDTNILARAVQRKSSADAYRPTGPALARSK
jgi:hypothetical protein